MVGAERCVLRQVLGNEWPVFMNVCSLNAWVWVNMVEQFFEFSVRDASGDAVSDSAANRSDANDLLGGLRGESSVATSRGLVKVDALRADDLLLTRDNGYVALRAIQRLALTSVGSREQDVLITANALGPLFPSQDICVAPTQLVLLHDLSKFSSQETLARAGDLANHYRGIRFIPASRTRFAVQCDHHEVILVDGIWVGTGYTHDTYGASLMSASSMSGLLARDASARLARPVTDFATDKLSPLASYRR